MSRNAFMYSSLTLGATLVTIWLLHAAFTALLPDPAAVGIVTAIVVAFSIGALSALLVLRFGAWLKIALGERAGERAKDMPPRRMYVPAPSTPANAATSATSATRHGLEMDYSPVVLVQDGIPRLLDPPPASRRAGVIAWAEFDAQQGRHVHHTIDVASLRRFARLHTPSRSEWSGKATTYTEALACFRHYAWVRPTGGGRGVEWVAPYTKVQRRLAYLGDTADTAALLAPS